MQVSALVSPGATSPLCRSTVQRRAVQPDDVLIDIKFCGICHSDLHTVRGEWGETKWPLAPGHEVVGVVEAVGEAVKKFKVGDRVGVGCMVDSCRTCKNCTRGEENYCDRGATFTYGSVDKYGAVTHGGYTTKIVVTEDFVVRIPDSLAFAVAAPLLCAGITTYAPLKNWACGPGKKVAIVGLGGLGHMAVKIAVAMGAEVTVLSQTLAKQADAAKLGAHHFYATSDPETFKSLAGTFNLILNTVSAKLDLQKYFSLLDIAGAMVNVGAPSGTMDISPFWLFKNRRSYAGSMIGGIRETQEMMDFCAEKGIAADIELVGVDQVNEAYERMLKSDVRYRFVIDISTLA